MAIRTFLDSAGNEWQAFDVVPRADERRRLDRRSDYLRHPERPEAPRHPERTDYLRHPERSEGSAAQPARLSKPEDRRDADRRLTIGGRSPLASGVADGWLCFERGDERRRLSPIPPGWSRCTDEQLEAYCQSARPVRRESIIDREPCQSVS